MLDKLSIADTKVFPNSAINVNTASIEALLAVLGSDNIDLVERIISTRGDLTPEEKSTTAWLLKSGLVNSSKFKTIAPLLTARGFQHRVQVVGYGTDSGRYCVLEAIVDPLGGRVLYLRDLTSLGMPFALKNLQERPGD